VTLPQRDADFKDFWKEMEAHEPKRPQPKKPGRFKKLLQAHSKDLLFDELKAHAVMAWVFFEILNAILLMTTRSWFYLLTGALGVFEVSTCARATWRPISWKRER